MSFSKPFPLQVFDPVWKDNYSMEYDFDLLGNSVSKHELFIEDPLKVTNAVLKKYGWVIFIVTSYFTIITVLSIYGIKWYVSSAKKIIALILAMIGVLKSVMKRQDPAYPFYKGLFKWNGMKAPTEEEFEMIRHMLTAMVRVPIRDQLELAKRLTKKKKKKKKKSSDDDDEEEEEEKADENLDEIWDEALTEEIREFRHSRTKNQDDIPQFDGRNGQMP